ncbi:uncharacterized protein LOC116926803 [Daphnia magna]|uniref:uncharacterized protein LOC116926803 n=1 Tax=Daphnia magna TaxID=35525 RepID=UPI001E1BD300|nr:uncharacterized protein LOC116926803 [Daphnia magna]
MRIIFLFALVLCGLFLNGWCEEEDDETDKIVSGYRVPNNRVYPYMVYFTQRNRLRQDTFICSGTLVGPRKVLTAASCFEQFDSNTFQPSFFTPVARMNTEILGGPYTISRNIIRVVKHPQYNPANAGNHDNIAVVTLDTEPPRFDVGSPILFNGMQIGVVGKNMRCGGSEPIVASG